MKMGIRSKEMANKLRLVKIIYKLQPNDSFYRSFNLGNYKG